MSIEALRQYAKGLHPEAGRVLDHLVDSYPIDPNMLDEWALATIVRLSGELSQAHHMLSPLACKLCGEPPDCDCAQVERTEGTESI